jgi:hypothetical protein
VLDTALGLKRHGVDVGVVIGGTRAVSAEGAAHATDRLRQAGVRIE